jgi:hypothetical protein
MTTTSGRLCTTGFSLARPKHRLTARKGAANYGCCQYGAMTADGELEDEVVDAQAGASLSSPAETRRTLNVETGDHVPGQVWKAPLDISALVSPDLLRSVAGFAQRYEAVAGIVPKIDYGGLTGVGANALSGLTKAAEIQPLVKTLGSSNGALTGIRLPSIAKGIFKPLDALGAAAGFGPTFDTSLFGASLTTGLDYTGILDGVLPANLFAGPVTTWLPKGDFSVFGIDVGRLAALELGFRGSSGTEADAFGELDGIVDADGALRWNVKRAIASTQRPGPFGFDYGALQSQAADLSSRFDDEPAVEKQVRAALEPVQEITGLTDERLIQLGEALGFWKRVVRHRVSAAGLILGYTVGLASYVAQAGTGTAVPQALIEAIVVGGGLYGFVHRRDSEK